MTVQTLLELKVDMMGDSGEALGVLEQTWDEQNRPTEQPGLIRVLKLTLDRCNRRGIFYPRIFLRRKGELRRGEFRPQTESQSLIDPGAVIFTAAAHLKIPAEWIRQGVEDIVK